MFDRREKNAEIFKDTVRQYRANNELKTAIKKSISEQLFIGENESCEISGTMEKVGEVVVTSAKTFEAGKKYANQGKKVCVLNFASATNPGGGVKNGSSAQEESLCRCSTLYPCLNELYEVFYLPHRNAHNALYNDDCIFTPGVKVFKSDGDFAETLPQNEWWDVDVITCAAPNLRAVSSNAMNPCAGKKANISKDELRELLRKRIGRIFEVAIRSEADALVLGAFGCGAFRNPPEVVAGVFAEYTEKYREYFDVIEYAVYHRPNEKENYEAFVKAMKKWEE